MTGETVFVPIRGAGGMSRVYHTDPECLFLEKAESYREISPEVMFEDRRECKACASAMRNNPSGTGRGHLESLLEAAEADEEGSA